MFCVVVLEMNGQETIPETQGQSKYLHVLYAKPSNKVYEFNERDEINGFNKFIHDKINETSTTNTQWLIYWLVWHDIICAINNKQTVRVISICRKIGYYDTIKSSENGPF